MEKGEGKIVYRNIDIVFYYILLLIYEFDQGVENHACCHYLLEQTGLVHYAHGCSLLPCMVDLYRL